MQVIMEATQEDRTIEMSYTVKRSTGFVPTDADPATQKGHGTITFNDGLVLNIRDFNLLIGENGPISGSILTERSDGYTTSMYYYEDGSTGGNIFLNGKFVASFYINADGSGTYTDSSGKVYPIS